MPPRHQAEPFRRRRASSRQPGSQAVHFARRCHRGWPRRPLRVRGPVAIRDSCSARSPSFLATTVRSPATSAATANTATSPRSRLTERRSSATSRLRRISSAARSPSRRSTLARTYSLSLDRERTFVVSAHEAICSSRAPWSRKLASLPPAAHSAAAFDELPLVRMSSLASADPAAQPRPRTEQRLVRDLDGGLTRRRVAVERQQPVAAERLDHAFHRSRVGERSELRTRHAAARVLAALAEGHEPQEQLTARLLPPGRSSPRTAAPPVEPGRRRRRRSADTPPASGSRPSGARRAR